MPAGNFEEFKRCYLAFGFTRSVGWVVPQTLASTATAPGGTPVDRYAARLTQGFASVAPVAVDSLTQ